MSATDEEGRCLRVRQREIGKREPNLNNHTSQAWKSRLSHFFLFINHAIMQCGVRCLEERLASQNPCLSNWLARTEYGRNPKHKAQFRGQENLLTCLNRREFKEGRRNSLFGAGEKSRRWPKGRLTLRSKMLGLDLCCNEFGGRSLSFRGCKDDWAILYRKLIRVGSNVSNENITCASVSPLTIYRCRVMCAIEKFFGL